MVHMTSSKTDIAVVRDRQIEMKHTEMKDKTQK